MSRTNLVLDDMHRVPRDPSFNNDHIILNKQNNHKYSFQGGTPDESRRRLIRENLSSQNVILIAQNFDRDFPRRYELAANCI